MRMVFWRCENFVTCQSVFYLSLHHISWSPASFPLFHQSHGRRDILSETIPHQLTPCFQEKAQAGKVVLPNSVAPCSHMWLQVCSPLYKHPTCPHLRIFLVFDHAQSQCWLQGLKDCVDLPGVFGLKTGSYVVVDLMLLQHQWMLALCQVRK